MGTSIERHVGERGARGAVLADGAGCCCCCCCLHSLAGLIAAATVAAPKGPEVIVPAATIEVGTLPPKYSAAGVYWMCVLIVSALAVAVFFGPSDYKFEEGLLLIALVFPAIQLGASVIAAIAILVSSRPGKELRMAHLGKITLRAFLWGFVGGVVVLLALKGM